MWHLEPQKYDSTFLKLNASELYVDAQSIESRSMSVWLKFH
jgi:hypothetical protein